MTPTLNLHAESATVELHPEWETQSFVEPRQLALPPASRRAEFAEYDATAIQWKGDETWWPAPPLRD